MLYSSHLAQRFTARQLTCCCRLLCSDRLSQPGVVPALLVLFSAGAERWSSAEDTAAKLVDMICTAASQNISRSLVLPDSAPPHHKIFPGHLCCLILLRTGCHCMQGSRDNQTRRESCELPAPHLALLATHWIACLRLLGDCLLVLFCRMKHLASQLMCCLSLPRSAVTCFLPLFKGACHSPARKSIASHPTSAAGCLCPNA